MELHIFLPAQFAIERARCHGIATAVEYLEFSKHDVRDRDRIRKLAIQYANHKGMKATELGHTQHSRRYRTTRFAIIPA